MLSVAGSNQPEYSSQVRSECTLMTPQRAKDILAHQNGKNRAIRPNTVTRLANDIKEGRWQVTHQGIAFDENNILIDGQHRLHAIAQANVPCEIMVSWNVPRKSFAVLDCGVSRTAADNLGYLNVPRAKIVAPGIKHIILYNRYPKRTWSNIPFPSHTEIANFYSKNANLFDELSAVVATTAQQFKKVNPTGLLVVCYLAIDAGHSTSSVHAFCHAMGTGKNLSDTDSVLAYRNFLINSNNSPVDRSLQQYSIACLIKAFNCWCEGKLVRQFKAPTFGSTKPNKPPQPMPSITHPALPNTAALSSKVKDSILQRFNYQCQQCGAREIDGAILQVDHIIPRSKGGSNDVANLQCLCSICNNKKSNIF
jgi:hypothetical protein